ncbi:VOC family protein [Flavobacterium sp. MK4S-17]|uniref:VOC family protein n=1 Tax=Flavobacterium sp. MK4S-17 TaxID=2543737 RepID=UPI00135770EC|nr:VOC family protein [Flavobacterium sp. MK4S-17]
MKSINPYLNFNGNTEEVFNFYKKVLGGDFAHVMRYKDVPADVPMDGCIDPEGAKPREDLSEKIMHIALSYGNSVLMGSDVPPHMEKVKAGTNIALSITVDSKEEADRVFAGLSEGGVQIMPMADAFWGDYFGMLVDKFGIQWMVSFSTQEYIK